MLYFSLLNYIPIAFCYKVFNKATEKRNPRNLKLLSNTEIPSFHGFIEDIWQGAQRGAVASAGGVCIQGFVLVADSERMMDYSKELSFARGC